MNSIRTFEWRTNLLQCVKKQQMPYILVNLVSYKQNMIWLFDFHGSSPPPFHAFYQKIHTQLPTNHNSEWVTYTTYIVSVSVYDNNNTHS